MSKKNWLIFLISFQCGIVLSSLLLILSNILSRSTCHFLLKSAIISRRRNYELLGEEFLQDLCSNFVGAEKLSLWLDLRFESYFLKLMRSFFDGSSKQWHHYKYKLKIKTDMVEPGKSSCCSNSFHLAWMLGMMIFGWKSHVILTLRPNHRIFRGK